MPTSAGRKRPFGVTVIIIVQLMSLVMLALDLFVFDTDYMISILFPNFKETMTASTIVILFIAVQLITIIGLWRLKRWAWFLLMIQLGLSMAASLWAYLQGANSYIYMLLNVIMVFYLNQRDVQRAFERRSRGRETA